MAEFGPVEFWVDGHPKGQPRPRAFAKAMGGGKFSARVFDSGQAEGWKGCVALAARPFLPPTPYAGPVWLRLWFAMPRPGKHYRESAKAGRSLKDNAPTWHTGKPDSDNLAKAVLDVLTQIGMWADDAAVCKLEVGKVYGEKPGCNVKIDTVGVVR